MALSLPLSALLTFALLGCGGAQHTPIEPSVRPTWQVQQVEGALYLRNADKSLQRNRLLYAFAPLGAAGLRKSAQRKAGLLYIVEPQGDGLYRVDWHAGPDAVTPALLMAGALRAEPVADDSVPRIGRYWCRHLPQPPAAWSPTKPPILELNCGRGVGVKADAIYEVKGPPRADAINRTVDSYETLGRCAVVPFEIDPTRARCELIMPPTGSRFGKEHFVRGGFVRALD